MGSPNKRNEIFAALAQKSKEQETRLDETQAIMAELVRGRRRKIEGDSTANERLAIAETVIAELISDWRETLQSAIEESEKMIRRKLG